MVPAPCVKFVLTSDYSVMPKYHTDGSAGFDLHSVEDVWISGGETAMVDVGLKSEIPEGCEIQVRSRSSMARSGMIVANSPGTIDSDYRGEWKVILHNLTPFTRQIGIGDRIAQGVIQSVQQADFLEIEENELSTTDRGSGGFGSTGK